MISKDYQYQTKGTSILTAVFKKYLVLPWVSLLPQWLPANIITILSNSLMYFSLFLAYDQSVLGRMNFIVIPALLVLYLIGDQLDGLQAKKTGTNSALGEFLDHFLDVLNNGVLLMTLFLLFDISNVYLQAFPLVVFYLVQVAVYYEQFKTGWLIIARIGWLEAVLVCALIIFVSYFESGYLFFSNELVNGLTFLECILLVTGGWACIKFAKILTRIKAITYAFWLFCVLFLLTGYLCTQLFGDNMTFIIITLYSSIYIGKIMQGHLIDGVERSPGFFTPIILFTVMFVASIANINYSVVIAIYLMANVLLLLYKVLIPLRSHWFWINPNT